MVIFRGTAHLDPLLSAGFGTEVPAFIFLIFFLFFKCRFGRLSAGFARLSAGFGDLSTGLCRKNEKKITISRKGSPSCALNDTEE